MLHKDLLHQELERKRESFLNFSRSQNRECELFRTVLRELSSKTSEEVVSAIADGGETGAIPSSELDGGGSITKKFEANWTNHQEARAWAAEILARRTTFAADGSQVFVEKETTLPVGAVQIGWFENHHDPGKPYAKDARLEILTPDDLIEGEPADPATRIGERRFHGEVKRVGEFLEDKQGWEARGERMPLAFFDGTLLVSFSLPQTNLQKGFVSAMVDLVGKSEETRVPVIGYVDRSLSRDLLNLLAAFGRTDLSSGISLTDAVFVSTLKDQVADWGDRTLFFYSDRHGMAAFKNSVTGYSSVGFCYLRTASEGPPARLDIPSWVFDAGLLDELADIVRAECVIGVGYPYPLETADAAAVISARDRAVFLKALQEFAHREELNFNVARKDTSKARRR